MKFGFEYTVVSETYEECMFFPYMSLCKTSDPKGGAIFNPRAII